MTSMYELIDLDSWYTIEAPSKWIIAPSVILITWVLWSILAFAWNRSTYWEFFNLPWVGDASTTDLRSAMEEGTKKFPNRPFVLPLQDPTVILPHHVIDEVKSLPDSQASIEANNHRRFFGRYTLMGTKSDEFVTAIKQDLTRHVGSLLPEMVEETEYTTNSIFKNHDEASSETLPVYATMLRYIALLSGRAFVGLPLSRNEEWIQSSINYAVESVEAGHQLRAYPTSLRWFVAPFLRKIRRVQEHQVRVREMLHDVLVRQQVSHVSKEDVDSGQGRLAYWLLRHYRSKSQVSEMTLGKDHLLASFAAIHIATNALTQVLLDLAARTEYQDLLLEEVRATLASSEDGALTMAGIAKMNKLDSFVKESLRASPPGGVVTLMRQTTAPFEPSCGPRIPKGTLIAFANNRFDMSSPPAFAADDFDGFRYARLREADSGAKHQLLTPNPDSLTWGYGSHACPGRLFAATELKVIVIHFLTRFQLRLGNSNNRPVNSSHDFQIMPDPKAEITFTRRTTK